MWKGYLAFYTFAGVTIGMPLVDLDYTIRAPLYALIAVTLQVVNFIPNATGPLPRISGRVTWLVTVLLLFYSAVYWLVGSIREMGGNWLLEVSLTIPSMLVVFGVVLSEARRTKDTDKRHDEDPRE